MKKKFLPVVALTLVTATSCSLFAKHVWSWDASTADNVIKYCLLIGQLDHNDSMERTRGVREILGTRPEKEYQKTNYNLEEPKIGSIVLNENKKVDPSVPEGHFQVQEIEHMEQKSFSGATWDPITANSSASTWISKHGKNITFFASNNDGMAEGAIKASNWYEDMPIFGYDANESTLKLINQGRIIGTIDSTTYGQCLASSILIRNIYHHYETKDATQDYDPCIEGFSEAEPLSYGEGYMRSAATFKGCELGQEGDRAVLLNNRAIAKEGHSSEETGGEEIIAAKEFFKDDEKTPLTKQELYDKYEGIIKPKTDAISHPIRVWQSWYNSADVFFTGNMNPLFAITQKLFNLSIIPAEGNGADESILLNSLDSALSKSEEERPEAFLINVVQQPNAIQYITKIAKAYEIPEKDNWEERSNIPIIFWNRQPTDRYGKVSSDVMNNKYFKYTYYVGFDAHQGGDLQGILAKLWLNKTYVANYKNGR